MRLLLCKGSVIDEYTFHRLSANPKPRLRSDGKVTYNCTEDKLFSVYGIENIFPSLLISNFGHKTIEILPIENGYIIREVINENK